MKLRTIAFIAAVCVTALVIPSLLKAEVQVDPEVRDAVFEDGTANTIVFLRADLPPRSDRDALFRAVAAVQDRFLATLPPGRLLQPRRFRSLPVIAGVLTEPGLDELSGRADVERIGIDRPVRAMLGQSVPLMNADVAQGIGFTGQGITVAVLDTGIDTDHENLSDDLVGENCFCANNGGCCPNGNTTQSGAGSAEDDQSHGTWVSGQITSSGSSGSVGVAPDASIVAIKILDANGSGLCSDGGLALEDIRDNWPAVDLVNMSLGSNPPFGGDCDGDGDPCVTVYEPVVQDLVNQGVAVFASSGNSGDATQILIPSCLSNVYSVGAVYDANVGSNTFTSNGNTICTDNSTAADQVCCYSQANPQLDLLAPGTCISSSNLGGGVGGCGQGTSAACPHAVGCAAVILEAGGSMSPGTLLNTMTSTGVPVNDGRNNTVYPRADCLAAVCQACGTINFTINPPAPDVVECTEIGGTPSDNIQVNDWAFPATATSDCGEIDDITHDNTLFLAVSCGGTDQHPVPFTATHICGQDDTEDGFLAVDDTTIPDLDVAGPITLECNMPEGRLLGDPDVQDWLNQASISDICDPNPSYFHDAPAEFPWGCSPGQPTAVHFTGSDECDNIALVQSQINVEDTTAPDLVVPAPDTFECTAKGGTPRTDPALAAWLAQAVATDICDTTPSLTDDGPALFPADCPPGQETVVTWTAGDDCLNLREASSSAFVQDTTPPAVVVASPVDTCIWPPNHKYVCFDGVKALADVEDICDEDDELTLEVACASDQCDDAPCPMYPGQNGDGHTTDDCVYDAQTDRICFRAERAGTNPEGRTYSVSLTASDSCGNTADTETLMTITVPHDSSEGACVSSL